MVICDRRAVGAALIVAAVAASVAMIQQGPPTDSKPAESKSTSNKNLVTVEGCVSGSMLTNTEPKSGTLEVPGTVRTTGSRAMRGQLKELNGHTVELTGILKGMENVAQGALVKDTGKTKIYIGGAEKRTGGDDQLQQRIQLPTLDVSSVKDIAPQCFNEKRN
jgi:hypothetical protein